MNSPSISARFTRRRIARLAAFPALLVLGIAVAAKPVPTSNLQSAQQAIANAERVEAATLAPVELGEARSKMSAAQAAVSEKEMIQAARLADEARASAELAAAKTGAAKASAVNADIRKTTATLVDEMQRKTGESK